MKLLLSVKCLSDNAPDAPNSCYIELSESDIQRITALQRLLADANAYSIEVLERFGTWNNLYVSEITDESFCDDTVSAIDSAECRIDCETLVVREDGFYFTCYPKHGSDAEKCSTVVVPHTTLADADIYIGDS